MANEINYENELKHNFSEIIKELKRGNEINIETTSKGIKIKSIKVKTINKKGGN